MKTQRGDIFIRRCSDTLCDGTHVQVLIGKRPGAQAYATFDTDAAGARELAASLCEVAAEIEGAGPRDKAELTGDGRRARWGRGGMSLLTFAELRGQNATRCNRWHSGGIDEWSVSDWAVAMLGEAGEAANAIKKLRRVETGVLSLNEPGRQLTDRNTAIAAIGEEIADTLIYLDLLALRLGLNLEELVVAKFNKVSERYGFPERLYDARADQVGSYEDAVREIGKRALYGYCPRCGARGQMRERRPNGDDRCENGHVYPSATAALLPKNAA